MPATPRRERSAQEEEARRGIMGHMQHLKAIGLALARAADTYVAEHKASEQVSDWRDDLDRNLAEANKEFHRTLAEEAKKVTDVYFGEAEPVEEPKPPTTTTKKGPSTSAET